MSEQTPNAQDLADLMVKWFQGKASDWERSVLLSAHYLKVTSKKYGHVAASNKGLRAAHKALGIPAEATERIIEDE